MNATTLVGVVAAQSRDEGEYDNVSAAVLAMCTSPPDLKDMKEAMALQQQTNELLIRFQNYLRCLQFIVKPQTPDVEAQTNRCRKVHEYVNVTYKTISERVTKLNSMKSEATAPKVSLPSGPAGPGAGSGAGSQSAPVTVAMPMTLRIGSGAGGAGSAVAGAGSAASRPVPSSASSGSSGGGAGSGAGAAAAAAVPSALSKGVVKYEKALKQLAEAGFADVELNVRLLNNTGGDADTVMGWLLDNL